jgi:hypothetical protein
MESMKIPDIGSTQFLIVYEKDNKIYCKIVNNNLTNDKFKINLGKDYNINPFALANIYDYDELIELRRQGFTEIDLNELYS